MHLKTKGSEKPQNLCFVRSSNSQKMNQNQKNERILYLKLIPIMFMYMGFLMKDVGQIGVLKKERLVKVGFSLNHMCVHQDLLCQ